jgi:hypothetical protein
MTRDIGRKFSLKIISGGIIKEKSYSTNVFLREKFLFLCSERNFFALFYVYSIKHWTIFALIGRSA